MDTLKAGAESGGGGGGGYAEPGPCVLLSWEPETEVGQTANWETRAVLIATVEQESRQLLLKSVSRPSAPPRRSFCHGGSAEGSEDESARPEAGSVTRTGGDLGVLGAACSQGKVERANKDINDRSKSE